MSVQTTQESSAGLTASPPYTKKNFNGPCFVKVLVNNVTAGSIIGKSGSVIHHIESETGSAIKLSPANCYFPCTNDRLVVVSGKQEQINNALLTIIDKLRESPAVYGLEEGGSGRTGVLQLRLVVPKSCVSAVIGRGGQQIKQLQELTHAKIQISNREEGLNERILTISGNFDALQQAALAVAATIQSDPNLKDHLYVVYPPTNTPALGQYNNTFSPPSPYMQQPTTFVQQLNGALPHRPSTPGYIHRGSGHAAHLAQQLGHPPPSIATHMAGSAPVYSFHPPTGASGPGAGSELLSHACEIVLQIPDSAVGPVIGKNGVCLSDIIFTSGARIRISPKGELVEGTQDRRCVIRGTVAAVHAAHIMLLQRLEAVEANGRQSHFGGGDGIGGGVIGSGYVNRGGMERGFELQHGAFGV